MLKRKLNTGDWFLILANLLPLYGVWFEGWDPRQMFLVYCLETIIIGGYNVIKMLIVTFYKKKDVWQSSGRNVTYMGGWFFILFFICHYGLFVLIQTGIFAGVSNLSSDGNYGSLTFLSRAFSYLTLDAKIVLYVFIFMYGIRMVVEFILSGKYRHTSMGLLMFQPYVRIFIQQFVVILGSIFLALGAGKIFMLIFVAVKIYAEVFINFDNYLNKAQQMQELKNKIERNDIRPDDRSGMS